jgi:hypothetical protein
MALPKPMHRVAIRPSKTRRTDEKWKALQKHPLGETGVDRINGNNHRQFWKWPLR